jgi:hypothetical protein
MEAIMESKIKEFLKEGVDRTGQYNKKITYILTSTILSNVLMILPNILIIYLLIE